MSAAFIERALAMRLDPSDFAAVSSALSETEREQVTAALRASFFDGISRALVISLDQDGRKRLVRLCLHAIPTLDPPRVLATLRDVTRDREREKTLAILESAIQHAGDFFIVAQPAQDGWPVISFVNESFVRFVGTDTSELLGQPLDSVLSARANATVREGLTQKIKRRAPFAHELLVGRRNGQPDTWIEMTGRELKDDLGSPLSWLLLGRDISVHKAQLAQTAQLLVALDLADEPIAIYEFGDDFDPEPAYLNKRAVETGSHPLAELLSSDDNRRGVVEICAELTDAAQARFLMRTREDGSVRRWVTIQLKPVCSGSGSIDSIAAIEREIGRTTTPGSDSTLAIALAKELRSRESFEERRAGVCVVLAREWKLACSYVRAEKPSPVTLHFKALNGSVGFGPGILEDGCTTVAFVWKEMLMPRELTALRVFLETLADG